MVVLVEIIYILFSLVWLGFGILGIIIFGAWGIAFLLLVLEILKNGDRMENKNCLVSIG